MTPETTSLCGGAFVPLERLFMIKKNCGPRDGEEAFRSAVFEPLLRHQ